MENEFKLPSVKEETKKREVQTELLDNETVVVETIAPCYVGMTFRNPGIRFMTERKVANQLVTDGCAFIVE